MTVTDILIRNAVLAVFGLSLVGLVYLPWIIARAALRRKKWQSAAYTAAWLVLHAVVMPVAMFMLAFDQEDADTWSAFMLTVGMAAAAIAWLWLQESTS